MSNTIKVIRSNGKTKNFLDVCGVEYEPSGENVDMEISIAGGESATHDFFIETVTLNPGDQAYLVNSHGTTVDMIRVKK